MIHYGRQTIDEDDIASVVKVLRSGLITQGAMPARFEQAVADYTGAKYAVAVANGTAALHVACLALGLGEGDLAWTVTNTFVASANAIKYCGADIDFVDIDPDTLNISFNQLKQKLTAAKQSGRLPKLLIVVHFAGHPCDLKAIREITAEYGVAIIEDAAHALGAAYEGHKIGAGQYSDITTFSFHPVKTITTAEGGMVTTNSSCLAATMRKLANHGVNRMLPESETPGPWFYQQETLGYNYRLSDLHAALGVSQLQKIDTFLARREEIWQRYADEFTLPPYRVQKMQAGCVSAHHLYVLMMPELSAADKNQLYHMAESEGVRLNCHYYPVPLHPYYQSLGFSRQDCPVASAYYDSAFSLPIYPTLSEREQDHVISLMHRFTKQLTWA